MAADNERWGYSRIVGELSTLGVVVSRSSVRRILLEHGLEPAPERLEHMPWAKFLRTHWAGLAAADFFTIEVWSKFGLVRYSVFFILELATRRVEIAGISPVPKGLWMEQIARNLVDEMAGFLRGKTHLIHDRDPLFTRGFRELLQSAGVTSVRLPPRRGESERLRRAIRALDQIRVPEPIGDPRRASPPASDRGVRGTLSPRADASGIGQSADRGRSRTRVRPGRPTWAARRTPQSLLSRSGVTPRSSIGTARGRAP